jgi:hypothetical protein
MISNIICIRSINTITLVLFNHKSYVKQKLMDGIYSEFDIRIFTFVKIKDQDA